MTDHRSPWLALGLPSMINAAGKMTYLGSSAVSERVAEALSTAAASHVDMAELKAAAGCRAAQLIGVPAACIVSCAAAGIVQSVAAAITGTDLTLIEQVPVVDVAKRDVLIQKSHAVNFGAPLTQMIRLGGGNVIEIGSANRSEAHHLATALSDRTAAVVYAVTHHANFERAIDLEDVIDLAYRRGVPVIVDAAAETDLKKYVDLGASLVVHSGHKAISGPTSGLVTGAFRHVAAVAAQEGGAGRAMKVSKEAIAGLMAALERYVLGDPAATADELARRLDALVSSCGTGLPVTFARVWDSTRPIPRLVVRPSDESPVTVREMIALLEGGNPSIRTRNHHADQGSISIDPREMSVQDAEEIGLALHGILTRRKKEV